MDVTARLLKVFQVEKQLRGLQSRLTSAERFLADQNKDLSQIEAQRASLDAQVRAMTVQAADREGEMKRLDERMGVIRKQMESAQTNREYQAFLLELNNYKTDRDKLETAALDFLSKVDELRKSIAELDAKKAERDKVRGVASTERDTRFKEIEGRLRELKAMRDEAVKDVDAAALAILNRLLTQRGEEAMASVQVQDRKRHEYTCGSCQMSIPIDAVNALLSKGKMTLCASCQCILFMDEDAMKAMEPPKKHAGRASKA